MSNAVLICRGAKDTKSDMNMYGRTKLFNIMSSTEFNRRLKGTGVESFSCHPGVAKTDLYAPGKMDKDKLSSKVRDARCNLCPLGLHPLTCSDSECLKESMAHSIKACIPGFIWDTKLRSYCICRS